MLGLSEAVDRLLEAAKNREKIVIHGDFDVDGITATAVMLNILDALDADVGSVIPHRQQDGYGLNEETIRRLAKEQVELLVSVDCGITSVAEVALAKELGLDVIIIDHHEPPSVLPVADVVVNPKQPECKYKFKEMAAVGLAFCVAQALGAKAGLEKVALEQLDLVALGTVADVVPLIGENRALVAQGLRQLREKPRLGLAQLLEVSGLTPEGLTAGHLGFALAPRLNAAGRLKSADVGLQLLRTNDLADARRIADELNRLNRERRQIEEKMMAEAIKMIEASQLGSTIVLAAEGWHDGVKGIVASRLVERYSRPTIMFSIKDGLYMGSARSIAALDIHEALGACSEWLVRWGGHKGAAGMTVAADNWEAFREGFEAVVAKTLDGVDFVEPVAIDLELLGEDINERFVEELDRLAPFGKGNPTPVFSLHNVAANDYRDLSGGRHLRFLAQIGGVVTEAVAFRIDPDGILNKRKPVLDIALQLGIREFRGRSELQFKVIDARAPKNAASATDGVKVEVPRAETGYYLPSSEVPASSTRITYIDDRGCEEPDKRLVELLEPGISAAVYTRDAHEGVQLAKRLEKLGLPGGAELYIVCTPEDAGAGTGRLFLYEVPLSRRALAGLVQAADAFSARRIVHLLFDEADLARAAETIETLCPSRAALADIFRVLRDGGPFDIDAGASLVREKLGNSIYQPATRQATSRVIKILAELRLLEKDEEGRFVVSGTTTRTDLGDSQSWRLLCQQKQEFESFQKIALNSGVEDFPG